MTWQIMMRGLAQAGNRTSKTALCRQWWDSKLEWNADASGTGNQRHSGLFVAMALGAPKCSQSYHLGSLGFLSTSVGDPLQCWELCYALHGILIKMAPCSVSYLCQGVSCNDLADKIDLYAARLPHN